MVNASEFIPLISDIIHVTGGHDTGKTTFGLECGAMPADICFFDDDVKGRATVEELRRLQDFGAYHDLVTLNEGKTEVEFYLACMELVNAIRPGQFNAIIWDTWTRFAKCMHPYVVTHRDEFKKHWSSMGKIKGAEEWIEAQQLEARVLNKLRSLAPVVVIVTHLKDYYANNAKVPGKQVPAASRTINRVPGFRIWLKHNPTSPVPIGLVYKRVAVRKITPRGIRTISVLPRKIMPREGDESLWDTIAYYFENPVGLRDLTADEIPDEFEMSILNETLTKDQKMTLMAMLKANAVDSSDMMDDEGIEEELEKDIDAELQAVVNQLKEEGESVSVPKLSKASGYEIKTVMKYWGGLDK